MNFSSARMDRLIEIALRGNVEELHQLLVENPLILHQVSLVCAENPLHFASAAGHLDFTKEILMLKPEFAKELNAEGYSPMHLASANGQVEIVREIIGVDPTICRLQGIEGKTPLHFAVVRGRVDVICEMLAKCEGCMEDVTVQGETALHLAVRNCQFASLRVMLDWIRQKNKTEILNRKDKHGNTILHLAIWKKQRQVLELLLGNDPRTVEVNAINNSGLTALDLLLIFLSEAGDREVQEILQNAGALKAQDLAIQTSSRSSQTGVPLVENGSSSFVEYFKFHSGRDSPSDVRSTLLVIAVLVATATYQVGINPPGNVWQDDQGHVAGTSILGTHDWISYILLIACNSIGFCVSLYMIDKLTTKFPLQTELQICLFALYFTYNLAVPGTSPRGARLFTSIFTSVLPAIVPILCNLQRKHTVFKRIAGMFRCRS